MHRTLLSLALGLLLAAPAAAQQRAPAPPAPNEDPEVEEPKDPENPRRKRRRAPPAPDPGKPVREPQVVDHFKPDRGAPGSRVKIIGHHFDDTCTVRLNGRPLKIVKRKDTKLVVIIPRRAETDSFVVHKAGFREVTIEKPFFVIKRPVLRVFQPRQAHIGDEVTVYGKNFLPDDEFFLGKAKMDTKQVEAERAVVIVPKVARSARLHIRRAGRAAARSRHKLDVALPAPHIDNFHPQSGPPGTVVRIEGAHFEVKDMPRIGKTKLKVVVRGPNFIEVKINRRAMTGPLVLVGRMGRRVVSAGEFSVVRPPKIKRFFPKYGTPGTVVTLVGVGFVQGDLVKLNDSALTVRTVGDRKLVAELPAGLESGVLSVERNGKKFRARGRFEVIMPPRVVEVSPLLGPPGTEVTIRGANFLKGASVLMAGRKLKIRKRRRHKAGEIVAEIPPEARTGRLVVVTRAGSTQSPEPFRVTQFAVVTSFSPLHGLPGTVVTIRGRDFHPGLKVRLGKVDVPVEDVEEHECKVRIPEEAPTATFVITSYGKAEETATEFTVDVPKPEVSFTFSPRRGRRGSEVTLTLDPPRQEVMVFFGDRPLPKKVLHAGEQLVVTIPGDARSDYFELEYNGRRYRAEKKFRVR